MREIGDALNLKSVNNFLISTKFVIFLLIAISILTALGIVIPQGEPDDIYSQRYGNRFGNLVVSLGLNNLYKLWVYRIPFLLLSLDLILCSTRRVKRLLKVFSKPEEEVDSRPNEQLYERNLRINGETPELAPELIRFLKRSLYHVGSKKDGGDNSILISASRGKISLLGSTIVHAGLLIIIFGVLWGGVYGFKRYVKIVEGASYVEPSENFLVRMDKLELDYYESEKEDTTAKDFLLSDVQGTFTVLEDGKPVLTRELEIGEALKYKGFRFRIDYDGIGWSYRLRLTNPLGWQWTLSIWPWSSGIPLSRLNWVIYVHNLYPDFATDSEGNPYSKTPFLRNPAVQIWIQEGREKPQLLGFLMPDGPLEYGEYTIEIDDFRQYAAIHVSKQPGISFIWIGFGFIMTGLMFIYCMDYRKIRATISMREGKINIHLVGRGTRAGKIPLRSIDSMVTIIKRSYVNEDSEEDVYHES